jgi:hypothetical protein
MKIRPKETFEQTHQRHISNGGGAFGSVDFIKFVKNNNYEFYIVPKVVSIDLEADECEIDYPFEEVNTHFGTYDFMRDYARLRPIRINCTGCAICQWMAETRLPKMMFKMAVPTKFFICYVIHEKKIKVAWFQDYLYANLMEKIAKLMTDKEINLIDAFRHRVKLFTNSEGKFDIDVNSEVAIPTDSTGYQNILVSVNRKPLNKLIEQQVVCDPETINAVLTSLQSFEQEIIDAEKQRVSHEKMEYKTEQLKATLEGFAPPASDYKPGGNEPFVEGDESESIGPSNVNDPPEEDVPF